MFRNPTQIYEKNNEFWLVVVFFSKALLALPAKLDSQSLRLAPGIALCSSQRGRRLSAISNTLEEDPADRRVGRATWPKRC